MNISKARSIGQLAYFCGCLALLEGRPNFLELRQRKVRRIYLPRTRVNKPLTMLKEERRSENIVEQYPLQMESLFAPVHLRGPDPQRLIAGS
jgi:hypothetical protein